MDIQIWENTIISWVNSLINSPISSTNQIDKSVITDIVKKIKFDFQNDPVEFLKDNFPNCDGITLSSSVDFLCAATLLLVYISFSKKHDLEKLKELMCTQLDTVTQNNIVEFLTSIQSHDDVFNFSLEIIKEKIYNFVKIQTTQVTVIGDCIKTPVKNNSSNNSFDSPLQGYFQTPKRNQNSIHSKRNSNFCGDGDHLKRIKKLSNQLVEEELEKASLQEKLLAYTKKCNEYEMSLRNKIEEIKHLKSEWEKDSKENEDEMKSLKNSIMKKLEDERKLKSELSHMESYVSALQLDISKSKSEKDKLESQLKGSLEKCSTYELQLKEITELNIQLQELIDQKEKELKQLRESYVLSYKDEKTIDLSYMNESLEGSVCVPENMGVVIDKMFRESVAENTLLKENIEELEKEKNSLLDNIKVMNEELVLKGTTISELQFLNKELHAKIESFDVNSKELAKVQNELIIANAEVERLIKENRQLNEKRNSSLQDGEQTSPNYKNLKMLLHINFLKLAEDFKAVQQRLEYEIKNISRLTSEAEDKFSKFEKSSEFLEVRETLAKCKGVLLNKDVDQSQNLNKVLECMEIPPNLNYSSLFIDNKIDKLTELLHHFENHHVEWSESRTSMQETCTQLNDNVVVLKMKITDLMEKQKKSQEEKIDLEKYLKNAEEKITEMRSSYSLEIQKLKDELDEKDKKIKKLMMETNKISENFIIEKEILLNQVTKLIKDNDELRQSCESSDFSRKPGLCNTFTQIDTSQPGFPLQELNDSLEVIPTCNKTFDIVNLEEKNVGNKTFSIKREEEDICKTEVPKNSAVWVVSPPSKVPPKETVKIYEKRRVQGESWVVPLAPVNKKKTSHSDNELTVKTVLTKEANNLTKSSSHSSVFEIDYSPPSKIESRSSAATSFCSADDLNCLKKDIEIEDIPVNESKMETAVSNIPEIYVQKAKSLDPPSFQKSNIVVNHILKSDESCKTLSVDFGNEKNNILEQKISELRKEVKEYSKECERLKLVLLESEIKRKKDKETFEKNQAIIRQNITAKYESQLEHLKNEMKQLYNRELAKHKAEQSKLNFELREQNKGYKEHIDELRNQLWDLGEKLLHEQTLKRDLERNYDDLKKKFENMVYNRDSDMRALLDSGVFHYKEPLTDENGRMTALRQLPNSTFPTIPTEDEDEVFDNRFLEDLKTGHCKVERPEGRLTELQNRNSMCLPHLKSSYPAETQFHNPKLFKENDLKFGLLQFGQESQSLTDSDHSMTRSLLPEDKGKKKDQTSYRKPGPPTPSKKGGRLSLQGDDLRLTPRNVLKKINDQNERNKGTPNPLKSIFTSKNVKSDCVWGKDENTAPVTPRKKLKIFRKPFGARDY